MDFMRDQQVTKLMNNKSIQKKKIMKDKWKILLLEIK